MKLLRVLCVLCLAALVVAPVAGCQKAVEKATGVKVDKNGNSVTVTGDEGEKVEIQGGDDVSLPDGFPDTVPEYEGAKLMSSNSVTSEGKTMYTVAYETSDDVKTVHAWYKEELPKEGWTVESESLTSSNGQDGGYIGAKNGESQMTLMTGKNTEDQKTTIVINATP